MAHRLLVPVVLSLLVSCSTMPPSVQCAADPDCGDGLVCVSGRCEPQPSGACRSDETQPCGPETVGACRKGIHRCIAGAFETACTGAVPATAETCNGVDDDCDGVVDNGLIQTFYVDADRDGFGSSAVGAETRQGCEAPAGFVASSSDCNDSVAAFNPSATEVCDAVGADEDCDGTANEGCGCPNVGLSQPCCAGRGTQRCEARDGGAAVLTACSVVASTELCNGIDDDCDGQTDELYSLVSLDGGSVVLADGGTIELDGGCAVGLGTCARSGASSCLSGALACNVVPGTPGAETCNTLDDDCDGQTDEVSPTLCSVAGQSCGAGTCACPAGQSICGASCQAIGGSCTAGTGACTRQGSVLCTNGAATCDAVAGTPGTEVCNGTDDDCDGQTDEASATLCSITGQSCSVGTCSCPGGQSVCGTSCQTLGASCSAGVGACLRSGAMACLSGGVACNATAGTPVAETCDGLDNDCNGTVDNGVTITCYPDGDNDQYATSTAASQQCPSPFRPAFGNCPVGFVAPAASLGIDCDPVNASLYRLVSTRADADSDSYCAGTPTTLCVGATAPAGRRFASTCLADDCNDAVASLYRIVSTRADGDGDQFCVGAASDTCIGATAPAGRRFAGQCFIGPDDCNDGSAAFSTNQVVRFDRDNDGYCVIGASITQCGGPAALPGSRLASTCNAVDDCKDTNANATSACTILGGSQSSPVSKTCGFGIPATATYPVIPGPCPNGFHRTNFYAAFVDGSSGGSAIALSESSLLMSCGAVVLGSFRFMIAADCAAD